MSYDLLYEDNFGHVILKLAQALDIVFAGVVCKPRVGRPCHPLLSGKVEERICTCLRNRQSARRCRSDAKIEFSINRAAAGCNTDNTNSRV